MMKQNANGRLCARMRSIILRLAFPQPFLDSPGHARVDGRAARKRRSCGGAPVIGVNGLFGYTARRGPPERSPAVEAGERSASSTSHRSADVPRASAGRGGPAKFDVRVSESTPPLDCPKRTARAPRRLRQAATSSAPTASASLRRRASNTPCRVRTTWTTPGREGVGRDARVARARLARNWADRGRTRG